jgi:hypothetical protein
LVFIQFYVPADLDMIRYDAYGTAGAVMYTLLEISLLTLNVNRQKREGM